MSALIRRTARRGTPRVPRGRRSKAGTLDAQLQFVTRASSRERPARRLPAIAMA
ncbi:hypothetical protein [Burkholderia singularis]|uniref:hypothetical protein n=1 Tax=Burkholderia singularis TaxID=1503053 RepID=UPI001357911D|nr:hypothetical protein [Burkholderia singularis]